MRILHVITSLRTGGAEKLMVDLLPRFKPLVSQIDLCVFDGASTPFYEELERKGVRIISFGLDQNVYNLKHIIRLARIMRNYDIVHTHNTAPQLFAAIAVQFVRNVRLITTEHNTTNRRRGKWYLKPGDYWMYRQYKKIICISDQAKTNLEAYIGKNKKIVTIFNGIDTELFSRTVPVLPRKSASEKIISMVAAFREQKDHRTLIEAFALLPDNYVLQLVGDGYLRNFIVDFAKQFNCFQRIHFLGNRTDVVEILKNSDVVVLSSHYEGLSISSLEGMACGRPFIASDVDGLREIVSGYGILVPHENAIELAGAIQKVIEYPEYAAIVVHKCLLRAKQFDINVMTNRYMQIYYDVSSL